MNVDKTEVHALDNAPRTSPTVLNNITIQKHTISELNPVNSMNTTHITNILVSALFTK